MKRNKWTTSQRLQFAAFAVAATRFMAMGAMALGVDLVKEYSAFFWLEVASWLGFAVLEGYAVPYLSKGTRRLEKRTGERRQLVIYRYIILSAIPLLGAPYYVAMSAKLSILQVLGPIYWVWAFLLCGVSALIIDAVGTVEGANEETQPSEPTTEPAKDNRRAVLDVVATYGMMDPGSIAEIADVPVDVVVRELEALYRAISAPVEPKVKRNGKAATV